MRKAMERQRRLDAGSVLGAVLNHNCRDELIPVLRGLQQVYATPKLREEILKLVGRDVSAESRSDLGREGLSYWCILVLAAVRLGCNLDDDKLQDLAENWSGPSPNKISSTADNADICLIQSLFAMMTW